jgi:hypothetical protein
MAGLTTNLRLELEKTNQAFNVWSENTHAWLDSTSSGFARNMEESERTLAALKENEAELETLREQNEVVKSTQKEEIGYYIQQKENLQSKMNELEPQLQALGEEEMRESARVKKIRDEYEALKAQAGRTMDDLTHGIRMYSGLGLEFQKAQDQCMKFIFTLIDSHDPTRQFFFLMRVDDDDKYRLVQCEPSLSDGYLHGLVTCLNKDNDIGKFVVNMRRAFQKLVK